MTTTKRKFSALLLLGALALAAGIGVSMRAEAAVQWDNTSGLIAITTDAAGVITLINYRHMNAERTVKGCGAKLESLPHLMEHYRLQKAVDIGLENGCLKGIRTRR